MQSSGIVIRAIWSASTCERMLWWLSMMPFGSPVEPDEKSTWKSESGVVRRAWAMSAGAPLRASFRARLRSCGVTDSSRSST